MNSHTTSSRLFARYGATLAGAVSGAIGLTAIVGWHTHNRAAIQVNPAFAPMQYNTALGFVLCGIALAAVVWHRNRIAIIAAAAVVCFAGLTLFEYAFGLNLGIDQLFMRAYVTVKTSHPGRMAPTTALCFAFAGVSMLTVSLRPQHHRSNSACGTLNSIVFALGFVALLAYVAGIENPYKWGNLTRMALHTAIGFLVLSAGALAHTVAQDVDRRWDSLRWLPISAGLAILALAVALRQSQLEQERQRIAQAVTTEREHSAQVIQTTLREYMRELVNLAKRWEHRQHIQQADWKADARHCMQRDPGYQSIEWLDKTAAPNWIVVPQRLGDAALSPNWENDQDYPARRTTIEGREVEIMQAVSITNGDKGLRARVPMLQQDQCTGYIQATLRFDGIWNAVVNETSARGFDITIFAGDEILIHRGTPDHVDDALWIQECEIGMPNSQRRMRIWPTADLISKMRSQLPNVTLFIGLLIAFLVTAIGYIARQAAQRARESIETEQKFRAVVESAPCAFIMVDRQGNIKLVRSQNEEYFGYSRHELIGRPVEILVPEAARGMHPQHRADYLKDPQSRAMGWGRVLHAVRKDGSQFCVEIALCPLTLHQESQVLCTIIDITRRVTNEQRLRDLNDELTEKAAELTRFNRAAVGREHRMIELKREVNELSEALGQKPRYEAAFLDDKIESETTLGT